MYIVRASTFMVNKKYQPVGNAVILETKGNTLKEAMARFHSSEENHDLTRSTPYSIYDVINTNEQ